jgi:Tfp pilus assembly protein PilV
MRTARHRRRPAREGGFTIMELLVTLLVTMIGIAAMFSVFGSTSAATADAREFNEALAQGESALEELQASSIAELEAMPPYTTITTTKWGPVEYHEGPGFGATGVSYTRTVEAKALDDDLVWFRIAVSWFSAGAEDNSDKAHRIQIETVRSRGEAPPR